MSFFKRMTFQRKLLIMVAIPVALLGVAIGALSFGKAESVVKRSQKGVLSDAVNRVDISINIKARQINSFMQVMSDSTQLAELVQWHASGAQGEFNTSSLRRFCENTWNSFPEITDVNVLLGDMLAYTNTSDGASLNAALLEGLYQRAGANPSRAHWSDMMEGLYLENDEAAPRRILVYQAICDADGPIGLIVLELDPLTLGSAVLTKQKILGYQTTFLADRSGAVIFSDNAIRPDQKEAMLGLYKSGKRKADLNVGNGGYYFCSQYNGLTGWITFTLIPEAKLFPESGSLKSYIAASVGISIALTAFFLMLLSVAITKPLAELADGMKQVQNENFRIHLPNNRHDEIGELTDSFNFMVNRINILINQVFKERLAQKNAELEALQAQINPHFLYNTLDSINWMLIDRGEMDVSDVVVALGKLMQYSMDTNTSMVSLEKEYANIKDYLMIQKNRFEDRLDFNLELEAGLEGFPVPRLILQPLVENAIEHGIVPYKNAGCVNVRAHRVNNALEITVSDDGMGMNAEQLETYRTLLESDASTGTSIGVHNVARRLRLHFNERCVFRVVSASNVGTSLTIAIPATGNEEQL